MKSSLKIKLLSISSTAILSIVGFIAYIVLETSIKREVSQVEKTIMATSNNVSAQIKNNVEKEFMLIESLAKLSIMKNTGYTQEELEMHKDILDKCEALTDLVKANPNKYENIAFYDKEGFVRIPSGKVIQLANKPYINGPCTTGKNYIDDPRLSTVNDKVQMFLSTPVYDINNNAIGCVVSVLQGNVFDNICSTIELSPGHYPMIVNSKTGKIVSHYSVELNDDIEKSVINLSKQKGIYNFDFFGEKFISLSLPIEETDWVVVCGVPYNFYFGHINKLRLKLLLLALFAEAIVILILFLVFHKSFKPLKNLDKSINEIANGNADLTQRIELKSKDEVGAVVSGFNQFTERLQNIMKDITKSKNSVAETYNALNENIINNKVNIEKSMNALLNATQEYSSMSQASEVTSSAIVQINSTIDSLNKMIENQSSAITEASASIEQMIGNINSVSKSVEAMAQEFELLQSATKLGIEKNTEVGDLLVKMSESSAILLEANKAISNVASQTNLLAMNAAIEAAHAGQFGKGFSVVADEIRKLAEESAKQSKHIGTELKSVSEQIETVVGQARVSSETFKRVNDEISNTSQLVSHIRNAMEEQGQGSKQILEALSDMNNSTLEVRNASSEMKEGSKQINDLMGGLATSQTNLKNAFTEMDSQMSNMRESTSQLDKMNKSLGKEVSNINEKVGQFKLS